VALNQDEFGVLSLDGDEFEEFLPVGERLLDGANVIGGVRRLAASICFCLTSCSTRNLSRSRWLKAIRSVSMGPSATYESGHFYNLVSLLQSERIGGPDRDRTGDPLLAKQA
jgi:hypothetical protein